MSSPDAPDTSPTGGGPSWTVKLLLIAIATGMSLLMAEGLLRVAWNNPYVGEKADVRLKISIGHAGTDRVVQRSLIDADPPPVRLRTDDRGYILPVDLHTAPTATVTFMGGSTTECVVVQEKLRFPALVSTVLADKGLKVNTRNAGRSGNSLHHSLNVLLNRVAPDRPDIVVLMHATNDIGYLNLPAGYRPAMGSPDTLGSWLKWPAQVLSSRSSLVVLMREVLLRRATGGGSADNRDHKSSSTAPVRHEPYARRLRAFIGICRGFGITPVLMTQPLAVTRNKLTPGWADPTNQDRFNDVIRRVAKSERVAVIDLARELPRKVADWDKMGRVFYDGMHVNDAGSRVYAEIIADALRTRVLGGP